MKLTSNYFNTWVSAWVIMDQKLPSLLPLVPVPEPLPVAELLWDKNRQLHDYYLGNGLARTVKQLKIQVVSDVDECQNLWEQFSPNKTLFDTWEFRLAFYNAYKPQVYFLTLQTAKEVMAVLPLFYYPDEKRYTWFGSTWQEENKFFVKNKQFIPLLISIAPAPLELNAIDRGEVDRCLPFFNLKRDDPKFILDLGPIKSVDDFLARLKKKRRYNLRRDRRLIEARQPEVIVDRFEDYDKLVELSIKRFTQKGEDTDWEVPERVEAFRQVIALAGKSYQIRMLSMEIDGKVAGVDLIAIYNGCYYPLKCGYDVQDYPGIGNYFNLVEMEDAISLGMKKMDYLEINYGWKDRWFESVPLYKYLA